MSTFLKFIKQSYCYLDYQACTDSQSHSKRKELLRIPGKLIHKIIIIIIIKH